jgi:hypothetical protein
MNSHLVTDASPAVSSSKNDVGKLNEKLQNLYCIIHQEVLCSEVVKLKHVLKHAVAIVNVRAQELNNAVGCIPS